MIFEQYLLAPFVVFGFLSAIPAQSLFVYSQIGLGLLFYWVFGGPAFAYLLILLSAVYWIQKQESKKWHIAGTILLTVQLLLIKYSMLLGMHASLAESLNLIASPGMAFPLGISFFTFELIHLLIERLKRQHTPLSPKDFWLYCLFFPTLIAGPIKRADQFITTINYWKRPNLSAFTEGAIRVLYGYLLKNCFADILLPATRALNSEQSLASMGRTSILIAIFAYSLRIYLDFSAYSHIALGLARCMGIQIPENFNNPYWARSPSEFWQRWHISLSKWFTDYVYIPLGGSRTSTLRRWINVTITFGISGLWHGTTLNFVLWGLLHALYLNTWTTTAQALSKSPIGQWSKLPIIRGTQRLLNFCIVSTLWLPFATDWKHLCIILKKFF